ncbi:MAG: peptidoglycan D,D-transpeptidase FtsI family protein [Acidimicrobiales bacterium]
MRLTLVVILIVVVARLVDVQVVESGRYRQAASEELTKPVAIPALRGGIYARNGEVMALSVPTKTVVADDFQIAHPKTEARALAPLLGVSAGPLAALLHQHSGYVPLAKNVPIANADRISTLAFPGITLISSSIREYPNGSLAAPVLGSVHATGAGASGLEYEYSKLLAGQAGSETLLESPGGVVLPGTPVAEHKVAHPGTGLELTLDEPLQYTTEQALAAEILASGAVSGTAIVMDVRTGDVLSMASLVSNPAKATAGGAGTVPTVSKGVARPGTLVPIGPTDPISEAPSNLAVSMVYEPGSVFKIVPFSAALGDGVVKPSTTFTVPDQIVFDGAIFHDATPHPTMQMTATQILAQSSNIGTSEITRALGEHRLLAQVGKLGFGKLSGLGFPGEEAGIIAGATQWSPTNYVSLPIGQVDATTPLQVLDAYNAVANGGVMERPRLVRATVSNQGAAVATPPSPGQRVMPTWVATEMRKMYEQVVDNGTGMNAVVPGYIVAGKTGTAQIPMTGQPGYISGAFMATFVGFAPARNPVLSAIVVLNRPTPIYGGSVAAPVFAQVMGYALHRYDIPTTPGAPGPGQPQVTGVTVAGQGQITGATGPVPGSGK